MWNSEPSGMRSSTSGDQRAWVFGLLTHPTHGIWDRCAFARCRGVLKYLRGGSTRVEDQDDARARAASRFGGNRQLVLHIASKHRRKKRQHTLASGTRHRSAEIRGYGRGAWRAPLQCSARRGSAGRFLPSEHRPRGQTRPQHRGQETCPSINGRDSCDSLDLR